MSNLPPRNSNGKLPALTSVGCYPIVYLVSRTGECLCADCAGTRLDYAADEPHSFIEVPDTADAYMEDAALECADCGEGIESAYDEVEELNADERVRIREWAEGDYK